MIQNFQEYIKNIDNISPQEKRDRERSLELFNKKGFPNKKLEGMEIHWHKKSYSTKFQWIKSKQQIS